MERSTSSEVSAAELARIARERVASLGAELVTSRTLPARAGGYADLPADLPEALLVAAHRLGIQRLYLHQRDAWDAVRDGRDLLLTTGTASGKSLGYQLPIAASQLASADATALALFPTKALAYDQAEGFARLTAAAGLAEGSVASYDGDTPASQRPGVRALVRTLVTNPDMLHAGILPHHTLWARFLAGLRFVVVDELHVYRGVFGGHLAGVVRRLLRIAAHYGAQPRLIATSATLGNPDEHARRVLGRDVAVISDDAAPHAAREVLLIRPPFLDEALGMRRAALAEAASLAERLATDGLQVLVFAGSRQGAEEAVIQLRSRIPGVRSYRSGLLASERRSIERELRDGSARVVVATNALELGIDIGGVDAVVIAGYPGSAAAFWQQVGRAGRRGRPGVGVLVLDAGPLDQYLARQPGHLFGAPPERALTDPDHLLLAMDHLRCAAFELPIEKGERLGCYGPDELALLAEQLSIDGEGYLADGRIYWVGQRYPADGMSLRSAGRDEVTLVREDGVTIGTLDAPSARWMAHPGAVYVHDGAPHLVVELDLDARVARLKPTGDEYVTRANRETSVEPVGRPRARPAYGASVLQGEVIVTDRVTGYRRLRRHTRETLARFPLEIAPSHLRTRAYAFVPDEQALALVRAQGSWNADRNDYGPDWPRLREAILARDGRACRVCGTRADSGTALHVHHLVPFRTFRSAAEANRSENLTTLCPSCHHRAEQTVRVRNGLAAVAYLLRSLAPLRVLCDARDLGVVSDPASAVAEGRPALLIYETVPGGVGLADELADRHEDLVAAALKVVRGCPCEHGCPACVGPAGEAGHAGKREARSLLGALAP